MSIPNQSHSNKVLISGAARTGKSEQIISRIKEYTEGDKKFLLIVPTADYVNQY